MSEALLKVIASAFKINADEFISTLKDGDDFLPDDQIGAEVSKLIADKVAAAKIQSRKNGQGEQNAKVLKAVKVAGFENPDNLQADELVAAFIAWKDEQSVPPSSDTPVDQMDKETLLKLPIIKSLVLEVKQESGKGNEAIKREFAEYKAQVERENQQRANERAHDIAERWTADSLKKGNVTLKVEGTDVSEAERIQSVFDRIVLREKIGLNEKREPIILGDDGEQKKDEFGNPIPFSDIAMKYGKSMYGVSVQNPSHEGANPPTSTGVPGQKDYVPKYRFGTTKEYDDAYMKASSPEDRLELSRSKQFHAEKAAGN